MNDKSLHQQINLFKHGIIEASAGTGKTYTIVELVLRILSSQDLKEKYGTFIPLKKILIVTYTEKATQELLERIHQRIQEEINVLKKDSDKNLQLIEHLQNCLLNFNQSSIYTLHSFCNNIIQNYHFIMQTGTDLTIVENQHLAEKEFYDLLPKYAEHFYKISQEKELPSLQSWIQKIIDICNNYDSSLHNILQPSFSTENQNKLEKNLLKQIQHFKRLLTAKNIPTIILCEYKKLKITKWAGLTGLQINKKKIEKVESVCFLMSKLYEFSDNTKYLNDLLSYLENDNFLKSVDKNQINNLFEFTKQEISTAMCLAELEKQTSAPCHQIIAEINSILFKIATFNFSKKWFYKVKPIFQMIEQVEKNITKKKQTNNLITYNDMISLVKNVFENKNHLILKQVKEQYLFGMIDEFQDTNFSQWFIFKSIFLNNEDKEHTLFVVGDPKQSIYSFQGTNLNIYFLAKKEILNQEGMEYQLYTNYRSTDSMIKGYNLIFQQLFSQNPSFKYHPVDSQEIVKNHKKNSKVIPSIVLQKFKCKLTSENLQLWYKSIAHHICLLSNKFSLDEICILTRTNQEIIEISQYLEESNIPYFHYKKKGLFQSKPCYHLILLLRFILKPLDLKNTKLLFASNFFKLPLQDLEPFDMKHPTFIFLWNLHELYKKNKWNALLYKIQNMINLYQSHKSDKDILKEILHFLYQKILDDNQHLEQILKTMLLYYHEKEGVQNEENLYSIKETSEKVQLMTIHTSKGLDFSVVFLSHLKLKTSLSPSNYSYVNEHNQKKIWVTPSVPLEIQEYIQKNDFYESLRLYYVAMTRAKKQLFLPIFFTSVKENHLINNIIDTVSSSNPEYFEEILWEEEIIKKTVPFEKQKEKNSLENIEIHEKEFDFELQHSVFPRLQKQTSYSQLVSSKNELLSHDEHSIKKEPGQSNISLPLINPLEDNLKSNATVGNMLHNILEKIPLHLINNYDTLQNFNNDLTIKQIIQNSQVKYNLKEDSSLITALLWNTFQAKLIDPFDTNNHFFLKDIQDYISEMNFCFSFNKQGKPFIQENFPNVTVGYIDLVFKHLNRYYILDWKSNLLNNYSQQSILDSMLQHSYDKQALIYTAATHQWLKSIQPDYDYHQHFGGIFYLYLRGLKENTSKGYYSHRYSLEELETRIENELQPMLRSQCFH